MSGNGNNGSLTAGVGWGNGKIGSALSLNGSGNDYARVSRVVANDFSICLYVKALSDSTSGSQWYHGQGLFDSEVSGVVNDYGVAYLNNKAAFGTGNPDTTIQSTQFINDGIWHQVCATRIQSSGSIFLYVDSNLQASTTEANTASLTAPTYSYMGSSNGGVGNHGIINGLIDDVRVYNRALSAAEIAAIYNAQK